AGHSRSEYRLNLPEDPRRHTRSPRFFLESIQVGVSFCDRCPSLVPMFLRVLAFLLEVCEVEIVAAVLAAVLQNALADISKAILVQLSPSFGFLKLFVERGEPRLVIVMIRAAILGCPLGSRSLAKLLQTAHLD